MPIYLNGETFILKHLNSTDSLSNLSKIIFSADILWQITSFNTEQGIFSVEMGLTFMSEQLNDLSSMILYQKTFHLYNMRQKGYVIGLENVGNWAWWKVPIKEDGFLHNGWSHLLSYFTTGFAYIGMTNKKA